MGKKCLYGKKTSLLILLAFTVSPLFAKPVIYSSFKFQYTDDFPDDTTIVRKMYDPETKKAYIESDDGRITSTLDIERINRNKEDAFRAKHGAINKNLAAILSEKENNDKVKVLIALALLRHNV